MTGQLFISVLLVNSYNILTTDAESTFIDKTEKSSQVGTPWTTGRGTDFSQVETPRILGGATHILRRQDRLSIGGLTDGSFLQNLKPYPGERERKMNGIRSHHYPVEMLTKVSSSCAGKSAQRTSALKINNRQKKKERNLSEESTRQFSVPIMDSTYMISKQTKAKTLRTKRETQLLSNDSLSVDPCSDLGTCQTRFKHDVWFCACDEECIKFDDCCHDYNKVANKSQKNDYAYRCYSWNTNDDPFSQTNRLLYGFLAVDDCPYNSSNATAVKLCKNGTLYEAGPYVVHNKTLVFRNKYCAHCNDVWNFEYFYIKNLVRSSRFQAFETSSKQELFETLVTSGYPLTYEPPPSTNPRACVTNIISHSCGQYINPVRFGNVLYKNMYCVPEHDKNIECLSESALRPADSPIDGRHNHLMSILFSFYPPGDEEKCKVLTKQTNTDEDCRGMVVYQNTETELIFYLILSKNLTVDHLERLTTLTEWLFLHPDVSSVTRIVWQVEKSHGIVKIEIAVRYMKAGFLHEVNNFYDEIKTRLITFELTIDRSIDFITAELVAEQPDSLKNESLQFISKTEKWVSFTNFQSRMISQNVFLGDHSYDIFSERCLISVTLAHSKLIVTAVRCSRPNVQTKQTRTIANIFMYICFSVSIISLLTSIILQRKHGLIVNIPSSNMENISVSLLLSNGLFIFAIETATSGQICYLVGVLLHFLWLSVFAFMSISVVCIAKTMRNISTKLQTESKVSKRVMFTVLGFLMPLMIVVTTTCLDWFGPSYWSVGYGEFPCFPSKYPANLVFVSVPIVFTITVNLFCLVYTIGRLCCIRLEAARVRKIDPLAEAVVYLRVCGISGVLWVLGIFDALFDEEWLTYSYTIACGLQGFLIALSNLTSVRIRQSKAKRQNECIQKREERKCEAESKL